MLLFTCTCAAANAVQMPTGNGGVAAVQVHQLKQFERDDNGLAQNTPRLRGAPRGNKNALGNQGNWYPRPHLVTGRLIATMMMDCSANRRGKLAKYLAKVLIRKALDGSLPAIKLILERIEGRTRTRRALSEIQRDNF
jgi:hypothetical protein